MTEDPDIVPAVPSPGYSIRPLWSKGPCLNCGRRLKEHDTEPIDTGYVRYTCPDPP